MLQGTLKSYQRTTNSILSVFKNVEISGNSGIFTDEALFVLGNVRGLVSFNKRKFQM